jgi:predicted phosphodiesterase
MRYAIISDIHANPVALEVALADARSRQADRIVCLGDVVGYGPDPVESVALCRSSCDVVLMGNHDAAVAGVIDTRGFIAFAQDGVRRHSAELNADDKGWLRSLPYVYRDRSILCAHGTPVYPDMFLYMNDAEPVAMSLEWMMKQKRRLLFIGHTHHACSLIYGPDNKLRVAKADEDMVLDRRSTYLVNVGSVGYPRADHDITYGELAAEHHGYPQFKAFRRRAAYGCNVERSLFYEESPFHPDWLLSDFIQILHPSVTGLPPLRYYQIVK